MADVRTLPVGEEIESGVTLDELAREGARRMIATALEAEVAEYVERSAGSATRMQCALWSATATPRSAG